MDKKLREKLNEFRELAEELGKNPVEILHHASEELQDKNRQKDLPAREDLEQRALQTEKKLEEKKEKVWEKVQLARHPDRPTSLEYIDMLSEQYMELHGDRYFGDDKALVGGLCTIDGVHFTFLANQKGKNMKENIQCHYGMAHPEGFRKALRLAKQAELFGRPIITFIDTPGAFPGLDSERRGIGEAIARNLMELSILKTPIICVLIGEGGSGGALAIGVGDKVYMLENSIYSVITPEGFASILFRDAGKAKDAAATMKLTSDEIYQYNLIDGIIIEPQGGAHSDPKTMAKNIKQVIMEAHASLRGKDIQTLIAQRSQKIIDLTREAESAPASKDIISRIKNFFFHLH